MMDATIFSYQSLQLGQFCISKWNVRSRRRDNRWARCPEAARGQRLLMAGNVGTGQRQQAEVDAQGVPTKANCRRRLAARDFSHQPTLAIG
jgi:hypothetical protein